MDPLDKLEMIFQGLQNDKKREYDRSHDKLSNLYYLGLKHEIDMLTVVLGKIRAVREDHPNVQDEMILKTYGPQK